MFCVLQSAGKAWLAHSKLGFFILFCLSPVSEADPETKIQIRVQLALCIHGFCIPRFNQPRMENT